MFTRIKNLDPNTKMLIRTVATIVVANAACVFVVKKLENKTN